MKRLLASSALLLSVAGVLVAGSTGAFFSDSETSTGNTFSAGALDLKVDNTSYYNGNKCAEVTAGIFQWVGTAAFPVAGTPCTTSWSLDDLANQAGITLHKFFDFHDLKPGDYSEDTISLHVENNAYICADITLTSNDDNAPTDPEVLDDQTTGPGLGELAQNINFLWWADDGDNVLEAGENLLPGGPLGALTIGVTTTVPIADSNENIFNPAHQGGPVAANVTHYIGKAWCFGNIAASPDDQDGVGNVKTPAGDNAGPAGTIPDGIAGKPEDGGYTCDGTGLGNETQTDSATVDVTFRAVQSRNNPKFVCTPGRDQATLTVVKVVTNNNGGNNVIPDFQLFVINGGFTQVFSGVPSQFAPGNYTVTEDGVNGYQATFTGDCNSQGQVTLAPGENKTCTITNDDIPPNITLRKVVTGTAPDPAVSFQLTVDGSVVPQNTSVAVTANAPHTINETQHAGHSFVSITGTSNYGQSCPATLGSSITLAEGEAITCTITNSKP